MPPTPVKLPVGKLPKSPSSPTKGGASTMRCSGVQDSTRTRAAANTQRGKKQSTGKSNPSKQGRSPSKGSLFLSLAPSVGTSHATFDAVLEHEPGVDGELDQEPPAVLEPHGEPDQDESPESLVAPSAPGGRGLWTKTKQLVIQNMADDKLRQILTSFDEEYLVASLQKEDIRFVRTQWFLKQDPDLYRIERRQKLEEYDEVDGKGPLLSGTEAVELLKSGQRAVGVLSYGWLAHYHPDAHRDRAKVLRRALQAQPHLEAFFWEQVPEDSNPRPCLSPERSDEADEARTFEPCLSQLCIVLSRGQAPWDPPHPSRTGQVQCRAGRNG